MADVTVTITGKDGVTRVFQEVTKGADLMAKSLEADAKDISSSMNKMSSDVAESSEKSSRSLKGFTEAGKEVGAGLGLLGASFTMFAQATADNERNITTLSRTFGDATQGLVEYADQIQATTTYSNDAAIAAEGIFASLARNYGLTVDQVKQLTSVSTDLAATSGLALEDVATRVAAAIRGEGEAAEALGLTMNQQSIDREGLTLSMTNQEAAQFRLNALYSQTAAFEGAAADQAATTTGQVKQLANSFQDAAQGVVEFSGPIGQAAAGISSFGVEAGVAVGGLVSLGKGINGLVQEAGGLKALLSASGTSKALIGGGVVAALGLAVYAAIELSDAMKSDLGPAFQEVNQQAGELDVTIGSLANTMSDKALVLDLSQGSDDLQSYLDLFNTYKSSVETTNDLKYPMGPPDGNFNDPGYVEYITNLNAARETVAQLDQETINYFGGIDEAVGRLNQGQDAFDAILSNTQAGAEDAMRSAQNLFNAFEASPQAASDLDALVQGLIDTQADIPHYAADAIAASAATDRLATSMESVNSASTLASNALENNRNGITDTENAATTAAAAMEAYTARVEENAAAWRAQSSAASTALEEERSHTTVYSTEDTAAADAADALVAKNRLQRMGDSIVAQRAYNDLIGQFASRSGDGYTAALELMAGSESKVAMTTDEMTAALIAGNTAAGITKDTFSGMPTVIDMLNAEMDAFTDKAIGMAESFGALSTNAKLFQAAGIGGESVDVAVNLQVGGEGVDAVFGAIKQAQALGSQLEGVDSWADKLIGDPGVWSDMDQLLADHRIDVTQYTAAQEAQVRITEDVANAQQDLLAVQVNLAPAMADATRAQAEYIDGLQDMGPEAQMAALGFMDQAKSAQAMEIAQLAAAASTDTMKAQTSDMIIQMANADPVLKSMLESMGLISETDGVITVDFSAAEGADSAMKALTESVDALVLALTGIPVVHLDVDTDDAEADTQSVMDKINEWGGITGTATADVDNDPAVTGISDVMAQINDWGGIEASATASVNDNASGTLFNIVDLINQIDGRTANSYVNTHYTVSGTPVGPTMPQVRNGGILGYANGGMVMAQLAEAGPELLSFANGGHAVVPNPGVYAVDVGTSVLPAPATRSILADAASAGGSGDFYIEQLIIYPASDDIGAAIEAKLRASYRGN